VNIAKRCAAHGAYGNGWEAGDKGSKPTAVAENVAIGVFVPVWRSFAVRSSKDSVASKHDLVNRKKTPVAWHFRCGVLAIMCTISGAASLSGNILSGALLIREQAGAASSTHHLFIAVAVDVIAS